MKKKMTAAQTITKYLKGRANATAKEVTARTKLNAKTVRNELANLVNGGGVSHITSLRKCRISGRKVIAYKGS